MKSWVSEMYHSQVLRQILDNWGDSLWVLEVVCERCLGALYVYTSVCACECSLEISVGVHLCQLVPKHTGVLVTAPTEPDLVL